MGKKSARKNLATVSATAACASVSKKSLEPAAPTTINGLPILKRIELRQLVDSLLQMALISTSVPDEQWQQYSDIQTLLDRIRSIEAELRWRPTPPAAAGAGFQAAAAGASGARSHQRTAQLSTFKRWARENGAQFEGIDIAEFAGYELGLVATKPLAAGELFVTVPQRLCLTVENGTTAALRQLIGRMPQPVQQMHSVRLALAVLVERLDKTSFWRPYLDVLPERYATVLAYSVTEMRELRGSSALLEALRQCRSIARQYALIHRLLHTELEPQLQGVQLGEGEAEIALVELLRERFTYELYCWAVSTVMTRQNAIPDPERQAPDADPATGKLDPATLRPALIPLWDMANHTNGRVTNVYCATEQRVEGSALRDFAKGEQIFIYYGDRRNSNFLIHNGFVFADNRNDSVVVRLGLSVQDALYAQRSLLMQRLQIGPLTELLVLPAPVYISGDMLAFVRVFNMNAAQLEHWLLADPCRAGDLRCIDCALDTELDRRTWSFLQVRFTLLLRAFPTTLAEDEALVVAAGRGPNKLSFMRTMLVQYRVLEKRMLTAALEWVSQRTRQ